ncbi:hypothetical protein F8388_008950 [Cannabis sativa]|uniref:Uncharacterized protein n=1 Tax=Cannabis sativa TaxID=3483 RepID=A0A7J6DMK5_CANSA|nr:hypothetical protein F8388_008950 [Cannabis sativa]
MRKFLPVVGVNSRIRSRSLLVPEGGGHGKTGIVTSRSAVVSLTVCLTSESAVSTAFPFAGCSSSLRVPIFAWAVSRRSSIRTFASTLS